MGHRLTLTLQIAPVELMPLALPAESTSPLLLDFTVDPTQLLRAVMQPEVLIEPLKHSAQMALLLPP